MEGGEASLAPAEATEYASVREWSRDASKSLFAPELAEEALQYLQQVTVDDVHSYAILHDLRHATWLHSKLLSNG